MRSLTIHIETRNAAFQDATPQELARIFEEFAADIRNGKIPAKLRDINGNVVGHVQVK